VSMDFQITGVEQALASLESVASQIIPTVSRSLYQSGEATMTKSKEQFVPIDTGSLKSSGTVQLEVSGPVVKVHLGFGGVAGSYAVFVHEINKNYRGGRQWKYLETPMKEDLPDTQNKLIDDLRGIRP